MNGDVQAFRRALLDHFDRTRRALPWRLERTPYRILVSEFMLQQTRVETVIPYYRRCLRRFPGWDALARAASAPEGAPGGVCGGGGGGGSGGG